MSKLYADGRPAEEGGRPIAYDAGGNPHVIGGAETPPQVGPHPSYSEVVQELGASRVQKVFLRETLKSILHTASSCPPTIEDFALWELVARICEVALSVTEEDK